jgi:hypothetical protein
VTVRTRRRPSICRLGCLGAVLGATLWAGTASGSASKPPSEKIGERLSRGVIQESLETLDEPENRARLGRIMSSPQMRDALQDLSASIMRGVFDAVREARKTGAIGKAEIGKSIGAALDEHVTAAAGRLTYRVVESAMSATLADEHLPQIEKLGETATRAAIRGLARGVEEDLGPALAATIEKDIGPAVAVVLARDILPAVGRGLESPPMQTAIAHLARSIATELVGGAGAAIDVKSDQNAAEGRESGLQLFGSKVAFGYTVATFVAFALGTMLVVLTVVLVRSSRRQRRQGAQAKQRDAALLHLIDSLESDHPQLKTDMRRILLV